MRLALWALATAFFLFLVVDWGTSVPTLTKCEKYDGESHEHNETKQCASLRSTILEGGEPIVYRTARWFDIHNGTVTGIATVFLAFITGWLVLAARDQSKTTRAQLRAYVMVDTAVTHDFGPRPRANVVFKNAGKTPAHDLTIWTSVKVATDPLDEKPVAPDGRANDRGPLAPGAGFYVFGQAQYHDVFGKNHTTDFCFIYGGRDGCHPNGAMAQYKDWNKAT